MKRPFYPPVFLGALTALCLGVAPVQPALAAPNDELRTALLEHNPSKVEAAIEKGGNPNLVMKDGDTALTYALRHDDEPIALMLARHPKVNVGLENAYGETPLMLAVIKKFSNTADVLLLRKSPVDRGTRIGWTPLHYAALIGDHDMVQKLLTLGANPNSQTKAGITPLMMAAKSRDYRTVQALLKKGAFRDVCKDTGESPADFARAAGDTKLAQYLRITKCAVKGLIYPDAPQEEGVKVEWHE